MRFSDFQSFREHDYVVDQRALSHPSLADQLCEAGIVLDVCMGLESQDWRCSYRIQSSRPGTRAAGIPCSIGTDDPAIFATDLTREFAMVAAAGGPSPAAAVKGAMRHSAKGKADNRRVPQRSVAPGLPSTQRRATPHFPTGGVHSRRLDSQAQRRSTPGIAVPQ